MSSEWFRTYSPYGEEDDLVVMVGERGYETPNAFTFRTYGRTARPAPEKAEQTA